MKNIVLVGCAVFLFLGGCSKTESGFAGAGIGTAVGAGIGYAIDGGSGGAIAGGLMGTIVGAAAGSATCKEDTYEPVCQSGNTYTQGTPSGRETLKKEVRQEHYNIEQEKIDFRKQELEKKRLELERKRLELEEKRLEKERIELEIQARKAKV